MAQDALDASFLRNCKKRDVVSYLDALRETHTDLAICHSLFDAIDCEYLRPFIFSIFLSWSKSPDVIALCIAHGPTLFIRRQGIKHFGRALIDAQRWNSAWTALGGTRGLVDAFAEMSVASLKTLARTIGRCNRGQRKIALREKAIEELLSALLPARNTQSKLQRKDKRPIQHHYSQMVPACSPEFVDQLLEAEDQSDPLYRALPRRRLIKAHGELLRKRIFEDLFENDYPSDNLDEFLRAFLYREPPEPGPKPKVSASMAFATRVLRARLKDIDNNKSWPKTISEVDVVSSLLRRSLRRKLPEAELHDVFMLALRLLESKPTSKQDYLSIDIWNMLFARWKRSPNMYDELLALALRLGLGGSERMLGQDYLKTARNLDAKSELRWPLLRLYCLHVPRQKVDLDTAKDFTPLAKQVWSSEVFFQLNEDRAVRLLNGLYDANPEYSFLHGPSRDSILSIQDITSQRNFNASLLMTLLQRQSKQAQTSGEKSVDDLRRKAATAREQSDRAQYAKAASALAIAIGNLDLYGETVIWLQRFVRDPLTLKAVFGHAAVATSEGIDLLCGIPEPVPANLTVAQAASKVAKANEILMTLHETMLIARREPSFHEPDWNGVISLFGSVISLRVKRAKSLQKSLPGSAADVFTAIWEGTLNMLEKVDVKFLNEAYFPIRGVILDLPPATLATTTKAMLDAGNERRKKQDRQPGDDTLERLSYNALLALVNGDKPELAQCLVLRTILDRPDASSWHRSLLSLGFMRSLSAKDAHEMLLAFATSIGEKLEEQSYVKVGEPQQPKAAPPQSLVKVTTVKYLAQLLDNAEFISPDAAVDVLVELFKAGTHRDIRLATLDSLLSVLNNLCGGVDDGWKSNPLVEKILKALETVIFVAGSINERRPLRPEEWKEAEETGTLPEVSDISASLPPLLNALLIAPQGHQYPGLRKLQGELVERILLPALETSQAEHRRWTIMFLAKHKSDLTIDELPPVPISVGVWDALLTHFPTLIPATVLEDFNGYLLMTIAAPIALKNFNHTLRTNTSLRNAPDVQHFLFVFDQRLSLYPISGTRTFVDMVHHDRPHSSINNGISFNRVLEKIVAHASLFLDAYETYTDVWNHFVRSLRRPTKSDHPLENSDFMRKRISSWEQSGRFVLERVHGLLLDKRNEQAERGKRNVLPSPTKLRLWLLTYPCMPNAAEVDDRCQTFAMELVDLLGTFLEGEVNVLRWHRIAEDAFTVSDLLSTDGERLRVAYHVGKLKEPPNGADHQSVSALNMVRIVLAMRLVLDGQGGLKDTQKRGLSEQKSGLELRMRKMIEAWQDDDDESIREKVSDWKKQNQDVWGKLSSKA